MLGVEDGRAAVPEEHQVWRPSRAQDTEPGRLMGLAPELLGHVFGFLGSSQDQRSVRQTCLHAVDAFSLAVRNEQQIPVAASRDAGGVTDVNDPTTRWFPLHPQHDVQSDALECIAVSFTRLRPSSRLIFISVLSARHTRAVVLIDDGTMQEVKSVFRHSSTIQTIRLVGFERLVVMKDLCRNCPKLTSVHLPNSFPCLREARDLFCACPSLIALRWPETPRLRRFRDLCSHATSLARVDLPDALPSLEVAGHLFLNCTVLKRIQLPDMPSLKRLWGNVLASCEALLEVEVGNLPSLVESRHWFFECFELVRARVGECPLLAISESWFAECLRLEAVVLPPGGFPKLYASTSWFANCYNVGAIVGKGPIREQLNVFQEQPVRYFDGCTHPKSAALKLSFCSEVGLAIVPKE